MTFPTPYLVGLHRYKEGAVNAHGKPVKDYEPVLQVRVVQWVPSQSGTFEPEPDSEFSWVDLFVPDVLTDESGNAVDDIGPFDLIDLPQGRYEVDGPLWDYSKGFHNWRAGKVVKLKRRAG